MLAAVVGALLFAAFRKRRAESTPPPDDSGSMVEDTHFSELRGDAAEKLAAMRKGGGNDSFVVEESGPHAGTRFSRRGRRISATPANCARPTDTMSSESPVNLDQGDPLAEADFHMAYGLYDQAADLVRIALEREPDRRDLRLKLLEIYFVWGNKDAFLQTAKTLEATRDRAPAGEWDKIVIMGKQICPDEPMFASTRGQRPRRRRAGRPQPRGRRESRRHRSVRRARGRAQQPRSLPGQGSDDTAATGESPGLHSVRPADLDFTLDTPERGADESPTREMPPRDEPTVETELMNFAESPTAGVAGAQDRRDAPPRDTPVGTSKADQTAEVSIDDLGPRSRASGADRLADLGATASRTLEETDHPADAPTMVAGLDERSRRMMEEAAAKQRTRTGILTELERELEASFIADLDSQQDEIKTAVLGPESAPDGADAARRRRRRRLRASSPRRSSPTSTRPSAVDVDSTSKLRGLKADSIDLDLDRLATALGTGDTVPSSRAAAEEVFSTEVFEASQRSRRVDLDVGEAMNGTEHHSDDKLQAQTNKLKAVDIADVRARAGDHERGRHQARSGARLYGHGRPGRCAQHSRGSRAGRFRQPETGSLAPDRIAAWLTMSEPGRRDDARRIAALVEYDGTDYAGWQSQAHAASLQDAVQEAIAFVAGQPIAAICAGRTDAGVHAAGQVIHFDTERGAHAARLGARRQHPSAARRSPCNGRARLPVDFMRATARGGAPTATAS